MAPSASEIRSQRPSATTPTGTRTPLGVPADYTTPGKPTLNYSSRWGWDRQISIETTPQPPRYFTGDEWKPSGFPPETIAKLQQEMVDAGLLTGKFRIAVWDAPSRKAYTELLETANAAGVDAPTALDQWAASVPADTEPERPPPPPLIQVSNADDLRAVFKAGARKVLGKKVDDATLDSWVAEFQGAQRTHQTARHDMTAGADAPGGTVEQPMSADIFVENKARTVDPTRADARKVVGKFASMIEMLGEGGVMNAEVPTQ